MKKLLMLTSMAGVMVTPNLYASFSGVDGTISFGSPTFQNGNGGEFNAITTPYSGHLSLGDFPTFCLEDNSYIAQPPSGPYSYTINSGAVSGGISGATTTDTLHTGLPMDNISIGTAWLYRQFRAGSLPMLSGSGNYTEDRLADAGALQQAIWWLEDETGAGIENNYVTLATTAVAALGYADVKSDSGGAFGVVVLNLFGGPYADANGLNQDQLAIVPVPEPSTVMAGVLLLIPLGISTVRIFRRNHGKSQK